MIRSTRPAAARLFATAIALTLAPACVEQSVDVEVNVTAPDADPDADPEPTSAGGEGEGEGEGEASTGEGGSGGEGSTGGDLPGDGSTSAPLPEDMPECGNGVVEAGEECDVDVAALCELEGFSCLYKRFAFVSQERRDGWSWAADRDSADEVCRSEAAAAGLAVAGAYAAFMARDGEGPAAGWQQPGVEYRNTCTGAPLAGMIDPWFDGFAWDVELQTPSADWPTCDAAGTPVAPPSLPVSGGEWRAAWFTFSQGRGLLAVDADCEPGEELGNGGWAKGDPYPDLELDGRALPCSAALPVLCMPGLSG